MTTELTTEKLLLTIPDAVAMTGYSRSFLYEHIGKGDLPVVRIGRTIRIRTDQLRAWIAGQQQPDG